MFVTRARLNYARMTEGNAETDVFFFLFLAENIQTIL